MDDYLISFTVKPYPTAGEDNNNAPLPCAAASSGALSRPHVHVRFSYRIFNDWVGDSGDDEEYEKDSRVICLNNDVLEEKSGEECRSLIFSKGLYGWPIDAVTIVEIADEVTEKARGLRCNLQVDIRSAE